MPNRKQTIPELTFHKVAEIFPLIVGKAFEALKEDIREKGQLEPIWLFKGQIIDGRNRYRACRELGIPPITRVWEGKGDPIDFVVSLNLARRHLKFIQRVKIAYQLTGRDLPPSETNGKPHKTLEQAAKLTGICEETLQRYNRIKSANIPALAKLIEEGELSVKTAYKLLQMACRKGTETVSDPNTGGTYHPWNHEILENFRNTDPRKLIKWAKMIQGNYDELICDIEFREATLRPPSLGNGIPKQETDLAQTARVVRLGDEEQDFTDECDSSNDLRNLKLPPKETGAKVIRKFASEMEREADGLKRVAEGLWEELGLFLVMIPRHGGILKITTGWSQFRRRNLARRFRTFSEEATKYAIELDNQLSTEYPESEDSDTQSVVERFDSDQSDDLTTEGTEE